MQDIANPNCRLEDLSVAQRTKLAFKYGFRELIEDLGKIMIAIDTSKSMPPIEQYLNLEPNDLVCVCDYQIKYLGLAKHMTSHKDNRGGSNLPLSLDEAQHLNVDTMILYTDGYVDLRSLIAKSNKYNIHLIWAIVCNPNFKWDKDYFYCDE